MSIERFFFFSYRRRHTRWPRDWSSDVCSSDLSGVLAVRDGCPQGAWSFQRHPADVWAHPALQSPQQGRTRSGAGTGDVDQSATTAEPGPLGPTLVPDSRSHAVTTYERHAHPGGRKTRPMNPLYPIEWAVAWIMVQFHSLLSIVMDPDSGWTWVLSIVGLTVVMRTLIIPLFVRQIRASRAMQMVSPELQAVQKKYKNKKDQESRQKMAEETMAIYKEAGASPFSSCLPVLLQLPIFFGLFRVLYNKLPQAAEGDAFGPLTTELANSAYNGSFLGAVTISNSFLSSGDGGIITKIVAGLIIASMCTVTFFTQKSLTMKNMPKAALEGPMASTQKMMLYMLPFIYVITVPGRSEEHTSELQSRGHL